MDETQIETARTSSERLGFFPPHRRRHLKSETYRTLVRIFSQCYDDSFASQNPDRDLNTENDGNGLGERIKEQGSQPVGLVGGESMEPKSSVSEKATEVNRSGDDNGSQDRRISEQMAIDQIEELMGLEENVDLSNQNDANLGSGPEQMIIDELEHIVKGNEDIVHENNSKPLRTPLLQNQCGINEVEPSKGQDKNAEFQQLEIKKPGNVSQPLSFLDDIVTGGTASSRANFADRHSNIDPSRQREVMELKSASAIGSNGSTIPTFGDVDKEETHAQTVCEDFNLSLGKDTVSDMLDSRSNDDQMSPRTNESKVEHEVQLKDSEPEKSVCDGDMVDSANHMTEEVDIEEGEISGGYSLDDISVDMLPQDTEIQKKKDAEVRPKKKRGPLSKEKRAKRKEKDRKKRAEKNRKLGVRRLKLHITSKPKPVNYCRHYLYGRCQEGDNCKFSHDVVPLTKSKPCCHFARHSCMKGDDCPFDHQLSKYPCSNFASRGFCSRGDDCMFSHKILSNEDAMTSSSAVEPETRSASLIGDFTPQKQQNNGASQQPSSALSCPTQMHSHKTTEKDLNETVLKQSELVAKGTSFRSVGNSLLADKLKQQILSPNGDGDAKAGKSGSVQNSNKPLNRTLPVVTPKGINFLSFGRVQRDYLIGSKLASSSSNGDNGVKPSLLDYSNMSNQTSSAPFTDSTPKGIQPAMAPKGINFLSFGKASTDDSSNKGKAKLPSGWDNGTDSCVKSQQNALDDLQWSSTTSSALPSTTVSLVPSLDCSASRSYKETPNLGQKALFSTLAFAARYESRMKSNQSSHDLSVGNQIDKEPMSDGTNGSSQNNLAKASKLLEFLSSIGSKSKQ